MSMKAMIFAAGLGTRLKPLTDTTPKALVAFAGKTLLQWQLDKLYAVGIREFVVNVHHLADQIVDYLQAHRMEGCQVYVSDETAMLLDTGGGLYRAKEWLKNDDGEPILVCNVDILSNIDLSSLMAAYDPEALGLIVVSPRKTQRYLLFDADGRLHGWQNIATGEKKPTDLNEEGLDAFAFSGMQLLNPKIFEYMDAFYEMKGPKFSLVDLYIYLCQNHTLKAYVPTNYQMMDVGKINQLEEAERFAQTMLL